MIYNDWYEIDALYFILQINILIYCLTHYSLLFLISFSNCFSFCLIILHILLFLFFICYLYFLLWLLLYEFKSEYNLLFENWIRIERNFETILAFSKRLLSFCLLSLAIPGQIADSLGSLAPRSRLFIARFRSRRGCTWLRYSSIHFTATCPNLIYILRSSSQCRHRLLTRRGKSTRPQGSLFYTCK